MAFKFSNALEAIMDDIVALSAQAMHVAAALASDDRLQRGGVLDGQCM